MGKVLVLAEKPSVGKELAAVLGCKKTGQGFIEGDKYIVTWALGHLVSLAEPESYGERYKTWNMESLPIMPQKMNLMVLKETSKQFGVVKKLLLSKEVSSLVIATDAGREGELVARLILAKVGFHKPIKRLWISSQTVKAIKEGFAHLKDGKEYENLYRSAQARAEADWLVGLNATRALTCKYNAQLSAGRVQTPTLALIVEREEEIKRFVPKDYYMVRADLGKFFVTYHDKKNQTGIFQAEKAEEVAAKIKEKSFTVSEVKVSKGSTPPPLLYDLTELQRDANKLYQMSPKETLAAMQQLYERHKALTYPRTDSRYLTDDMVATLPDRIRAVAKGDFAPFVSEILREKRKIAKSCINNSKVSDHHAIIPTEQSANVSAMSSAEKRIYLLVVKRFLTCFYPNYEFKKIRGEFICENETFSATGRVVVNKGWKAVTTNIVDDGEEEEQTLPDFQKGQVFTCKNVQKKVLKTTPPARYTEASLLSAMENPAKFIEDKRLTEFIDGGLGTPATRADIIEKLFSSFYVEKQGNSIHPTQKGIQLVKLAPKELREPLLTAKWEKELEAISKGKKNKEEFIQGIRQYTVEVVQSIKNSTEIYKHENMTKTPCPVCGKPMLSVAGKKGKMLVCQDRECGERIHISRETNVKCPVCHKRMELFGNDEKKTYICRCGFRERADRFHERLGATHGANKNTVQNYLKKQKMEEKKSGNELTALGKALMEAFTED